MVVFKLDRERPLAQVENTGNRLFMVKGPERSLVVEPLERGERSNPQPICTLRRPQNAMQSGMKNLEVNQYSPAESSAVLVFYSAESGSYDLCIGNQPPMSGHGAAVCFVQRNRFAVLQHSGSIGIYNFQNELSKKFDSPLPNSQIDNIFPGGNNRIILKLRRENLVEDRVAMYDIVTRKVINDCLVTGGVR